MPIDLTGGIDRAREHMFADRPADQEMRDSVSFWVFDDNGRVGFPRVGVEAIRDPGHRAGERLVQRRDGDLHRGAGTDARHRRWIR